MNYRKKLYATYILNHALYLYHELTLDSIKRQFPVWKRYYGRFLPQDKIAKLLDVGCGNGGFVYFLQMLGFKDSLGIDVSKEQVESAHKLGINNVLQYDIKEFLSIKQDTYDVIFSRDVIEHFIKDEILEILTLIFSSLRQEGKVILQCPNAESPFMGRIRYGDFTHEMAFTKNSLHQILTTTGFKHIDFYSTGPVPLGLKSTARYLLWKAIEMALRLYTVIETGSFSGIFTQNIIAVAKKDEI